MAVLAADLILRLQDSSSGFDLHVVDDGRSERLVAAMHDARRRIYEIRHPEEPEDSAVNWVGGPSAESGIIRLVVDLKDCPQLVAEVVDAVSDALDAAQLEDAVIGTSAVSRPPPVPPQTRGCPVLDALADALSSLSRGDPEAIQPPEATVAPDAVASRRRLVALLDLAIRQWSAANLDAAGLGELAAELRALPPLALGEGVTPMEHLAVLANALVAVRALVATLPRSTVVYLEKYYARGRSLWQPITGLVGRGHRAFCVQDVGVYPWTPVDQLWTLAAANLFGEALAGLGAIRCEADLDEQWSVASRVATGVLLGGEPGAVVAEIAGVEGDVVSAAIAADDLWREPVARITLAALADGGSWIAERSGQAIADGAASGGPDAVEPAIRSHLRVQARQAADFMVANGEP